jgi:hypothetical protein
MCSSDCDDGESRHIRLIYRRPAPCRRSFSLHCSCRRGSSSNSSSSSSSGSGSGSGSSSSSGGDAGSDAGSNNTDSGSTCRSHRPATVISRPRPRPRPRSCCCCPPPAPSCSYCCSTRVSSPCRPSYTTVTRTRTRTTIYYSPVRCRRVVECEPVRYCGW